MPRKMNAMLMKIASIMLVLGMFATAVAYAETPRDQYQNAQEQYQTLKDRVSEAQDSFQDSQEKFLDAKDRFETDRSIRNTEDLTEALRNFLNRTIDYTIKRLEALQIQAAEPEENGLAPFIISDNIDDYIGQLEGLRDDVETAETGDEFQAVIREVRNTWQNVDLESRYFIMGTLNNKVDTFLERTDSIADRIQAEIDRLEEAEEDTEELRVLLQEYETALDDAKDSHIEANRLFEDHDGFNDGGELQSAGDARAFLHDVTAQMRVTSQDLKEANSILREIFNELKDHRHGSVNLRGTGTLIAEGDGKATLSGNLELTVSAKNGIMTIKDYDGDAVIEINGKGTKEVLDDGTIKYEGFDGSATIRGSSITAVISGEDLELNAEGTGSAVLRGYGSYNVNGNQIKWAEPIQTTAQVQSQFNEEHLVPQQTNSEPGNQTQILNHTLNQTQIQTSDQPGGM